MKPESTNGPTDEQLAELAQLADGTLPPERRGDVEARVSASPELARMLAQQTAALDAIRHTADVGAPARLRAEVDRRRGAARPARRPGHRLAGLRVPIAVAAVALLALALVLPGALKGGPSVADAAALAQKPPTRPAPAAVPGTPQLLKAAVDGVPFPNYAAKFGWKPAGARQDNVSGRDATTVYYSKGGRTIAYTIVAGDALDRPDGARTTTRDGVTYDTLRSGGRTLVTWKRGGNTCVLSSTAVRSAELIALADWRGKGAIPF